MLVKRANILFEEENWKMLADLALQKRNSVSGFIRKAMMEVYFSEGEKMNKRKAFEEIISLRKKTKGKINYKSLIENGRKY